MTDTGNAYDEPLPWLQAVEDEDEPRGVSARKMLAALSVVVVAALIVSGIFFWLGRSDGETAGPPQLIHAEPGPYKIKPPNPGGLDVRGESETAFETSAGEDKDAQLDLNKLPEAPITHPRKEAPKTSVPSDTKLAPALATEPPKAPPPSAAAGSVIQLGAFANSAQAERAWSALSARFPLIVAMGKMIVPFPGGIRLRAAAASPADAKQACQTLKAAGENCFVAR